MAERSKVIVLIALGAVLALVLFYNFKGGSHASVAGKTTASYQPIAIENPALHLDRIERLRKLEYHPTGRDIFTAELPPPPRPKNAEERRPIGPPAPPPEPALVVPFKYYGFSADAVTKKRLGFFTNGEDVYIAAEGELLQGKFRVLSIGNTWAEVEETSSNRRARLTMEAPPPGTQ
jgi:hypothetical protein